MSKVAMAALALAVAGIGMGAKSQAPELRRYLKIKRM
jgi:hypothetical protein